MKLAKKLVGLGVVAVMGLTFATGALADSKTQDVEVDIKGGGLSLDIPGLDPINDITLTKERDSFNFGFNDVFTIRDLTGTQAGWKLSVSATALEDVSTGHQLPQGSLTIKPVESIKRINYGSHLSGLPNLNNGEEVIDNGSMTVASAEKGTGMGSFEISFKAGDALGLHIDALTAKEGTYESTITWDLVTAP